MPKVPYLKLAATRADGTLTLFALNRHLDEPMIISVTARGFGELSLEHARTLHDPDLGAVNTRCQPDRVGPRDLSRVEVQDGRIVATLPEASWSVIRLHTAP